MTDSLQFNSPADSTAFVEDSIIRQFLTFTVDGEEYGIDIMTVREIKGWTEATRLPNSPEFMRGVMNLRGLILPIFDLKSRFRLGTTDATDKHVVIIIAVNERNIGILVDTVSDILHVESAHIQPVPETQSAVDHAFINGLISLENRMVVLLNIDALFNLQELEHSMPLS